MNYSCFRVPIRSGGKVSARTGLKNRFNIEISFLTVYVRPLPPPQKNILKKGMHIICGLSPIQLLSILPQYN